MLEVHGGVPASSSIGDRGKQADHVRTHRARGAPSDWAQVSEALLAKAKQANKNVNDIAASLLAMFPKHWLPTLGASRLPDSEANTPCTNGLSLSPGCLGAKLLLKERR